MLHWWHIKNNLYLHTFYKLTQCVLSYFVDWNFQIDDHVIFQKRMSNFFHPNMYALSTYYFVIELKRICSTMLNRNEKSRYYYLVPSLRRKSSPLLLLNIMLVLCQLVFSSKPLSDQGKFLLFLISENMNHEQLSNFDSKAKVT